MHVTALIPLLLASLSTFSTASAARGSQLRLFGNDHVTDDGDSIPVPGDNPLVYCEKPDDYILSIDKVDLTPNPPKAGENLTITATGTLSRDIAEGARVNLQVKYGLIRLINMDLDLCEYAAQVDMSCPLKKGDVSIKKDVALPEVIPSGRYTVAAHAVTDDDEDITCLTASIAFKR